MKDVVIVGAKRTPLGSFQGALKDFTAPQLGSQAIQGALTHAGLTPDTLDTVMMGSVLMAGQGQAPARQASLGAGVPVHVPTSTLNKVCGSGLYTVMLASDMIRSGSSVTVAAGGMESMTQAPYILPKARRGLRFGHTQMLDHMLWDGLEDAYSKQAMGLLVEETAAQLGFSRQDQDAFTMETCRRAQNALAQKVFQEEIVPLAIKADGVIHDDEPIQKIVLDKIPTLKPAFRPDGTITAASASGICDGAACVILTSLHEAKKNNLKPLARIVAYASHAQEPKDFALAPIQAIRTVADRAGWALETVDLFEINEAFALVPMAAMAALKIPHSKVNMYGGACALGHPIGASGARLVVTLLNALNRTHQKKGIASLCIGGGEAVAIAIERL